MDTNTEVLLKQAEDLATSKSKQIDSLLQERVVITEETQSRLYEIKDELKALGYKAPRKKSTKKTLDTTSETK